MALVRYLFVSLFPLTEIRILTDVVGRVERALLWEDHKRFLCLVQYFSLHVYNW